MFYLIRKWIPCIIVSWEKQPITLRAWASVAWDYVRVVGLGLTFTIVKMLGPNINLSNSKKRCDSVYISYALCLIQCLMSTSSNVAQIRTFSDPLPCPQESGWHIGMPISSWTLRSKFKPQWGRINFVINSLLEWQISMTLVGCLIGWCKCFMDAWGPLRPETLPNKLTFWPKGAEDKEYRT